VLDLDITYSIDGEDNLHEVDHRGEAIASTISAVKSYMGGDKGAAMTEAKKVRVHFNISGVWIFPQDAKAGEGR
jgi:hypothetical protein